MPLILVVDDVELNIELLERKLENRGFETVARFPGRARWRLPKSIYRI